MLSKNLYRELQIAKNGSSKKAIYSIQDENGQEIWTPWTLKTITIANKAMLSLKRNDKERGTKTHATLIDLRDGEILKTLN